MKSLDLYAKKRFKKLGGHLKSYQHIRDQEVLHEIRLEIKKLKSVLNVTNYSVHKFKGHQHFKPLRAIFRQAGEIRQPDVFYKLFLRYQISGVTDSLLPSEKKIDALGVALQKAVPQLTTILSEERKELSYYFKKVKKSEASSYFKKRKGDLKQLLFPRFTNSSLHKARKIIKEILYLHVVIRHRKPPVFYKEAEEIIGKWHDKQMLIPLVKKSNDRDAIKTDEIKKLVAACKEDVTGLRSKVSLFYDNR